MSENEKLNRKLEEANKSTSLLSLAINFSALLNQHALHERK